MRFFFFYLSEKSGGNDRIDSSMRLYRETVDSCELIDLGFQGTALTWNNRQDLPDNIQEKLDRCLVTKDWRAKYPGARLFHQNFFGSDHRALHIVMDYPNRDDGDISASLRRFLFDPLCRTKDKYKDIVLNSWLQQAIGGDGKVFLETLDRCGSALRF